MRVSGFHAEDVFNRKTGLLDVTVKPRGLLFIPIVNDQIIPEVYNLENGNMIPLPGEYLPKGGIGKLRLSEAFVRPTEGVVNENNILLENSI